MTIGKVLSTTIVLASFTATAATPMRPVAAADPIQLAAAASRNDTCLDYSGVTNPDQQVISCTNAIETGRLEADALAQARLNRGAAYVAIGDMARGLLDYGEALRFYDKAIDVDKPSAMHLFRRGTAHHALGQTDRALLDYGRSLKIEPINVLALIDRGTLLARSGDNAAAAADFDRALEIKPDNVEALVYRGDSRARLGQLGPALADLDRAVELAPGNAQAFVVRGLANARRGDLRRASTDYAAALAIDATNVDALANRAAILSSTGKYDLAMNDLDAALKVRPNNALALYNRGYVRFARRQYAAAITDYSEAIRLDPTLVAARINRCLTRAVSGQDLKAALDDCNFALQAMPNNLDARETRAFIYLKQGEAQAAASEYDAVLKIDANRPLALYGRGLARAKKGDKDKGDADCAAARALYPTVEREFTAYGVN